MPSSCSSTVASTPPPRERAVGGHGTILFAEDEPLLRRIAARILTEAGYRVIAVNDGAEAVTAFGEQPDAIDLVILDLMMPRLDGIGACERIRARRSDVPVLFCSGYSASASTADEAGAGERLLAKPFRAGELLEAVRDVLDSSTRARPPRG